MSEKFTPDLLFYQFLPESIENIKNISTIHFFIEGGGGDSKVAKNDVEIYERSQGQPVT